MVTSVRDGCQIGPGAGWTQARETTILHTRLPPNPVTQDRPSPDGGSVGISASIGYGLAAVTAAVLGSMLGLGGGVFLVPLLTLFLDVDPRTAVGASAVCVVTNSVVGASVHIRSGFTNLRLAMLLQVTTAGGAIGGALIALEANPDVINGVLGAVLLYSAISMLRQRRVAIANAGTETPDRFGLRARYLDLASGAEVDYVPQRVPAGLGVSGAAGVLSGMLGIGGGVIQVPMMNLLMRVPVKAAAGTSALMVGMTAVATAAVFYADDKLDPRVVIPAMIGVFAGSRIGSQLTRRIATQRLVLVFVLVLVYLGGSLLLKALGVSLPGQD